MAEIIRLNGTRPITHEEMNSLTVQKDTTVITAICRALGRTDWDDLLQEHNGDPAQIWVRGKWMVYGSNSEEIFNEEVFSWDGREYLLFHPAEYDMLNDKWRRKVEWLSDPEDYVYHTKEDERG